MEQKIGDAATYSSWLLFHERVFGLAIIPPMTAPETLELFNP